jgi:hypothetical protein
LHRRVEPRSRGDQLPVVADHDGRRERHGGGDGGRGTDTIDHVPDDDVGYLVRDDR